MEELKASDPAIRAEMELSAQRLEQFTQQYIQNEYNPLQKVSIYTIPVVFHVLHMNGSENISDAQILDAVERMNEDFNKQNNNWNQVQSEFLSIVADIQVEFKLAKKKPNGDCFKGITRTETGTTFDDSGNDQVQAVQQVHGNFPGNMYLNIFVVANAGGAAGYTTYPSNWSGTSMSNGIKILHNYVGRIGTSSNSVSTALSHEVGHWLNLAHLWGNSNNPGQAGNCSDDDGVNDTPNTIGWTSCNLQGTTCDGVKDNVENFMEYSYCSKMFTEGQKARMHAALNSSVGSRNNIVSASNLTATGVNDPEVFCKADFYAPLRDVCAGSSIEFQDDSYFNPTQWNWTFEGGSPSTSTAQNPVVTYSTPGVYNVTLSSGDGSGTDQVTKTGYIRVLPTTSILPFMESFEAYSTIASSNGVWNIYNQGSDNEWEITQAAAHTGQKSVRLQNIGQPSGGVDELISGSFDLSGLNSGDDLTLSFRYSFKQRSSSNDDRLRVSASNNCGESWSTRRQLLSSSMSLGTQLSSWVPTSQDDWVTNHITNISSSFYVDGLRVKFEWQHGGGNNIYLDDINMYLGDVDPLGIEENTLISDINLFPNPTIDELTVRLSIQDAMDFDVKVVDLSGKAIDTFRIHGKPGTNDIMISTTDLAQGMYLVEVVSGSGKVVKQFVKR
ncbi:hypothetical protein GCM10009118_05400 [Wandonia haliotis]|uniref:PKD domain-containing protein n=2 Tax=Wandonia haliotis TaxID=574963 RepID=A0ABP3Y0C4_9FLAO